MTPNFLQEQFIAHSSTSFPTAKGRLIWYFLFYTYAVDFFIPYLTSSAGFRVQPSKKGRLINKIYFKVEYEYIEVLECTLKSITKLVKGLEGIPLRNDLGYCVCLHWKQHCNFLRRGRGEVLTSSRWKDFITRWVLAAQFFLCIA